MKKVVLLIGLLIPLIGLSQVPDKGITVTGVATTTVVPDQVSVTFQLGNINADPLAARVGLDEKNSKLQSYLHSADTSPGSLKSLSSSFFESVADYSVKPEDRKKQYTATMSYSIATSDINNYNSFINGLVKLGITNVNTQFIYSKTDELKRQLRSKAVANAREKAVDLAKQSGLIAGKAFQITDDESLNSNLLYIRGTSTGVNSPNGQISISTAVRISYQLLNK